MARRASKSEGEKALGEGYELIITEKPKVAARIANALAEGTVKRISEGGVPYYEIERGGRKILVGCAVGHLFGLMEKGGNKWKYPVFEVEWAPAYKIKKESAHTKKYIKALEAASAKSSFFTVATDYDIEGEVIGLNVLRFICKQKDGCRMKFSALTQKDLVRAYENKSPTIDWGQAEAGLLRHELDYYYGINISRALTSAIKSVGTFKVMSSGRVQGPALKIVVDREEQISSFVPKKYWQVILNGRVGSENFEAVHKHDRFWNKEEAELALRNASGSKCSVARVESSEVFKSPPFPFDLTTLQVEAYRCFGINPKRCLDIAQALYTEGLISYPRTSSQQLPLSIGFNEIMSSLQKQRDYALLIEKLTGMRGFQDLRSAKLTPNNGKKTDPAHPAIYPTGNAPKKLDSESEKIYDLIVKRFLATFGNPAVLERVKAEIASGPETFVCEGLSIRERGWMELYAPYANIKEAQLPKMEMGQQVKVLSIRIEEKETQPPKRYSPASLVSELSAKNLGTKATRATVVETLYKRGYIEGQAIRATQLGITTEKTLERYCPEIVDVELTRHFEDEADLVMEGKKKREEVLQEARELLTKVLLKFKKQEKEMGAELKDANEKTIHSQNTVGKCPSCNEGNLKILFSKKSGKRFIACDRYPECKTTFSIPQKGMVKPSEEKCEKCSWPIVLIINKGKRPWKFCLNPECPSKQEYYEKDNGTKESSKPVGEKKI
ncbi:MAG: DNA topoisomerase I [Candidatus Woesearchaeota archaeon]